MLQAAGPTPYITAFYPGGGHLQAAGAEAAMGERPNTATGLYH